MKAADRPERRTGSGLQPNPASRRQHAQEPGAEASQEDKAKAATGEDRILSLIPGATFALIVTFAGVDDRTITQ
ncbi:hypothetical protein CCHR01_02546 [Colletotrichum chrysophilum]|uniref:Uncharacterized protein n=1 Tax=Colletotrichum chrysophilum TaxID=1836956 RepID=A0AAD9ESB8_9PEZI|nr:hypothetical protein CCHR01_02546 [Colletotrichum chrysophilum]